MIFLNEVLSVIQELNGDLALPGGQGELLHMSDEVKLIICGNRHYFFAEYVEEAGSHNLGKIEETILFNEHFISNEPKPQQCYLIMLYKAAEINEFIYKKVIEIEENEFFFKRYVLYFTQEEFDAFVVWFNSQPSKKVESLLTLEEIEADMESSHIQFFLRLLIKLPFLDLTFKDINLSGFETIFHSALSKMRGEKPEQMRTLIDEIQPFIDAIESPDDAAAKFFDKKVGEITWDTK